MKNLEFSLCKSYEFHVGFLEEVLLRSGDLEAFQTHPESRKISEFETCQNLVPAVGMPKEGELLRE